MLQLEKENKEISPRDKRPGDNRRYWSAGMLNPRGVFTTSVPGVSIWR